MSDPFSQPIQVGDCIDAAARIASGARPPADNRRSHTRHPFHIDVPVVWLGPLRQSDRVGSVRASDISVGGVRILGRHMLYPRSTGVIQLTRPDGSMALVGVEIVHTAYIGEMRYASGCRFIPIPQDQLSRFMRAGMPVNLVPGQPAPGLIGDADAA
jgi:hypothetical protein